MNNNRDKFGFVIEGEAPPAPKRQWIDATGERVLLGLAASSKWVLLGLVVVAVVGIALLVSLLPDRSTVYVQDVRHEVINPSTIKVVWTVEGEAGGTTDCWVKASDPSGTYDGRDYVYDVELVTGTRTAWIPLSIDNEGAAWVTDVEVDCS